MRKNILLREIILRRGAHDFGPAPPLDKFITELDATRLLGLSVHQLRRLRAKGEVPHAKFGTRIVYTESSLKR